MIRTMYSHTLVARCPPRPTSAPPLKCLALKDASGRTACPAGVLKTVCSTAATNSRICGPGFAGAKEFTCTVDEATSHSKAAFWKETRSTCTGV